MSERLGLARLPLSERGGGGAANAVRGRVCDAAARPLEGANVHLIGVLRPEPRQLVYGEHVFPTDPEGRFTIHLRPPLMADLGFGTADRISCVIVIEPPLLRPDLPPLVTECDNRAEREARLGIPASLRRIRLEDEAGNTVDPKTSQALIELSTDPRPDAHWTWLYLGARDNARKAAFLFERGASLNAGWIRASAGGKISAPVSLAEAAGDLTLVLRPPAAQPAP